MSIENVVQIVPTVAEVAPIDISGTCVLAAFTQGKFSGKKLDRRKSEQLNQQNNAERGAAQVIKDIMDTSRPYIEINSFVQANGAKFREMTLPFNAKGQRICPNKGLTELQEFFSEAEVKYWDLQRAVLADYEDTKVRAKDRLGNRYDENDFPPISEVAGKYNFVYTYAPFPDTSHFLLDAANRQHQDIISKFKNQQAEELGNATAYLWGEYKKVLVPLMELPNKTRISDALLQNAQFFVRQLDRLNVTDNPEIKLARDFLDKATRGVNMDDIRADESYKKDVAKRASDILDKFKDNF